MTAYDLATKVRHLAPASQTAVKLMTLVDQSVVNNDKVVEIIKCDSILTAKLLRACNCAFYGFNEPVVSVEQAVLVLGHRQILRIIFAITFNRTLAAPLPGYAGDANDLWHHSLVTALNCEALARMELVNGVEPALAFTGGLLHDIGKLALNEVLAEDSQAAIRSHIQHHDQSCAEAEKEILGTDHAQVGASLLQMWKLPEDIVEAVGNHHHPVLQPQIRLSTLVHTADCLSHLIGSAFGWESFAVRVADGVTEVLELSPGQMDRLLVAAHGSLAQAKILENMK